jgi:hypothetical protein
LTINVERFIERKTWIKTVVPSGRFWPVLIPVICRKPKNVKWNGYKGRPYTETVTGI